MSQGVLEPRQARMSLPSHVPSEEQQRGTRGSDKAGRRGACTRLRLTQDRGTPLGVSNAGSRRSARSVASASRPSVYPGTRSGARFSSTCVDSSPPAPHHTWIRG